MQRLSVLYLYKKVVFPYCTLVAGTREKRHKSLAAGERVLALPIRGFLDILLSARRMATLAEVTSVEQDAGVVSVGLKGLARVRIKNLQKFFTADYELIPEETSDALDATVDALRKKSQELIFLINVNESDKLIHLLNFITSPHQLADFVANYFVIAFPRRYRIFRERDMTKRIRQLTEMLDELIHKFKTRRDTRAS